MSERFDVVVVGGGTAGLVAASGCARLGRRVALVERHALGGDCLWTGCVPTKALVATARLAHQMRHASAFGIENAEPRFTPKSVMDSMREAQAMTGRHDDPQKFRKLGIEIIEGDARLLSESDVQVGDRRLIAKDIVIATGSRTAVPPIRGLETFIDHASVLQRDHFPEKVVILGGGAIGVEFAQLLRRFGSDVTIIESSEEILAKEDAEVIARVKQALVDEGVKIETGRKIESVAELGDAEIFVAAGRRGNIENLGLENAGVATQGSYITVDKYLQTTAPRIWACGDVHGGLQFTHVAAYEAAKLVRNMLFPGKSALTYDDIPSAIYTDPEVARIGAIEGEKTYSVEMRDVDRAVVDRMTAGFLKLVCDGKGRILGAHLICANASTLIAPIVLARKAGMKIGQLAQLVTPYPSMADAIQKAAALYYQDVAKGSLGGIGRRIAAWSQ